MHDEREVGQAGFDLFEHIEVKRLTPLEFERAVAGADGASEGITTGELHKLLGFFRVGQAGVAFFDDDIFFDATEHAEFGFDGDAFGVSAVNDPLRDRDVLVEGIMRGIDHNGTEEPGIDTIVTGFFITVVEMDRENGFGEDIRSSADNGLKHALVGVFPSPFGDLDDKRCLGIDGSLKKAHRLLGVIDVERTHGVFSVGVFEQLCSSNDHVSVEESGKGDRIANLPI